MHLGEKLSDPMHSLAVGTLTTVLGNQKYPICNMYEIKYSISVNILQSLHD